MVLLLFNGCKKREEQVPMQESIKCVTIDDTEDKEVEELENKLRAALEHFEWKQP